MMLRALRPLNLLLVALTQGVCWLYLRARLGRYAFELLSAENLLVLVLSTGCITGAGYLINDVFDAAIDAHNKPRKALPATPRVRRRMMTAYLLLNGLGLLGAWSLANLAGKPSLVALQAVTILLLWAYSAFWKRLPVIGNGVVALLTALSILLVPLYEPVFWQPAASAVFTVKVLRAEECLRGLAGFAFLLTWMREMVKDIEDLEGDRAEGCRTLPIVWGVRRTVWATAGLSGIVMALLLAVGREVRPESPHPSAALLVVGGLVAALGWWTFGLLRSRTSKDFHRQSSLLKLLMPGGLLLLWLY